MLLRKQMLVLSHHYEYIIKINGLYCNNTKILLIPMHHILLLRTCICVSTSTTKFY